ncbi:zinc finger-containing ubiquitin peptidase 1 isoform X1 [Bemisia tabaci]|nr:PREDICTED: zinc finger with UFM1-specific peptidase domain protein-like [Bemisia tabaci]
MSIERGSSDFNCPLCSQSYSSASDLELHVNVEHEDILSPAKPNRIDLSTGPRSERNLQCPVCPQDVSFSDAETLQIHIDTHFSSKDVSPWSPNINMDRLLAQELEKADKETQRLQEEQEFELLKVQYGMDDECNFKEQSIKNMKKEVEAGTLSLADFANRQHGLRLAESNGLDDGSSCTQNLALVVAAASRNCSNVAGAFMCSYVDHYASTYGDRGWGCGYRNTQMILSSLLQHTGYNDRINQLWHVARNLACKEHSVPRSGMPSVSHLQKHVEWAWREGFDLQGAEQLGARVFNTRKWIGATEVTTILSSLKIRCQLVDFHRPTSPNGCHPELFNWVLQYFQSKDDFKPPLYLQHQGHSRTIIGVEQLKDEFVNLLVLDPSHPKSQMEKLKSTSPAISSLRLLRKTLYDMKAKQYQIVVVCGLVNSEAEYQRSKVLRSIQVPQK